MITTIKSQLVSPISFRTPLSDSSVSELQEECIRLLHQINGAAIPGDWEPSPAEGWQQGLREALLTTPGILHKFRRSFLAGGRLNFPDRPSPNYYYLEWDDDLSGQKKAGELALMRQLIKLYGHRPFTLDELNDNLVGQPTAYYITKPQADAVLKFARGLLGLVPEMKLGRRYLTRVQIMLLHNLVRIGHMLRGNGDGYNFTEAQIRYVYFRGQIGELIGDSFGAVLEIGGGYGGLGAELLRTQAIKQYILVELPDAMPLAYFYLRASFDCSIQVMYRPGETIDPNARIVILAPWKLPDIPSGIDLLVNTMSFQHMTEETLEFYLAEVDRLKTRSMYLVNRDLPSVNSYVKISDYPVPACYKTVHRKPWLFSHHQELVLQRG